ncbi:MAG: glycosyl transferase, partial [Legionellales bacterium]
MNVAASIVIILCSALMTKLFCRLALNTRLMDIPNERSAHSQPTIRGGGLVFIALPLLLLPFLCYFTQTPYAELSIFMIGTVLLALISFL